MSHDQDKKTFDKADLKIPVWPARKAKGKGQQARENSDQCYVNTAKPRQARVCPAH